MISLSVALKIRFQLSIRVKIEGIRFGAIGLMKGKLRLANVLGARDRYPLENLRNTRNRKKK